MTSMYLIQKAIIKRGDKFLTLLRSPKAQFFPNHWDFPGGRLEPGEDAAHGVEREVLEETSLAVKAIEPVAIYEMSLDGSGQVTHRFTLHTARIISGEVRLSHEHTDFKWATKEELLAMQTEPYIVYYFDYMTSQASGEGVQ